jgi:DNA-binding response OmpR family regulator
MPVTVLLVNLDPIVELGMTSVLEEEGINVLVAEAAGRLRPDAVVLDLGQATSRELGDRIRAASPETTLVFWARDEDVMEVVEPGRTEPRRVLTPVPAQLRSELLKSHVR